MILKILMDLTGSFNTRSIKLRKTYGWSFQANKVKEDIEEITGKA
jgi:hypothetical protein